MTGQRLRHYTILEKLGEGGMGAAYKARDSHLNRLVALKVLPPGKVADPERKKRFVQEARAASALNHPNIVTVHDIDQADGVDFIAMELVEGRTLEALIGGKGLKLNEALKYAVQIADALAKAHAAGIVHRDLKPGNVMVTGEGRVKVLDFGLAKLTEQPAPGEAGDSTMPAETQEGLIVGTLAYMSPEQAQGKRVDARSDIFSFGSLLYEMLTGRRPFRRDTPALTLAAILHLDPPPLGPEISPELAKVIERCLRKDPERRYQTMADLKVALEDLKEESDSGAVRKAAAPAKRGRRAWVIAAVVPAVLAAAGAGWWLTRGPRAAPQIQLARLTFDSGVTSTAAISPDGKLVAYASDRSGEGNLDIWVQQFNGRQPMRVTSNHMDNSSPTFSPDGSRIAFRTERDGGGISVADTLGGPEQRIAAGAYFPHFSPDGARILFLRHGAAAYAAKMYLVGARGGAPQPFQPEFSTPLIGGAAPSLAWSPDGKFILFEGIRDGDPKSQDWWVAPAAGGPAVRTGAAGALPKRGIIRFVCGWVGGAVYFLEGAMVESVDVYRAAIAPGTFAVRGPAEQLTQAGATHSSLSVAGDGRMVLVRWEPMVEPWSVALDANRGTISGEPQAMVRDSTVKGPPVCSRDGSKMAYVCWSGLRTQWRVEVRLRDLRTGQESVRAGRGETLDMSPRLSADGTSLAYRDEIEGRRESYLARGDSDPEKICDGCSVVDFFPGGKQLLVTSRPNQLERMDLETGRRLPVLASAGRISEAQLSADGRWAAFLTSKPDGAAALWIAPVQDPPVAEREWRYVTEDQRVLNSPQWSPDGNLLYFVSSRDGWACAWGQRLDPVRKTPQGEAFGVLHSHRTPGFRGIPRNARAVAVAANRLFFLFGELRGSAWTAKVGLQ